MKMKFARAVLQLFVLFGLLGVMAVNAVADGAGPVPYPPSGFVRSAQQ